MIVSYDIDGVLAEQPPQSPKKWGQMNGAERQQRKKYLYHWYANANRLLNPLENEFFAISARKSDPVVFGITNRWLDAHFPGRVKRCFLLQDSRTVENVIQFKSSVIQSYGIQRHYEDNKVVLRGMRKILPKNIELFFWEKGMIVPTIFEI